MSEEIIRCQVKVWLGWNRHQCKRKVWKDGCCKQHHPESIKKRCEVADKRYEEKQAKSPYALIKQLMEENKKLKEENDRFKKGKLIKIDANKLLTKAYSVEVEYSDDGKHWTPAKISDGKFVLPVDTMFYRSVFKGQ